MTQTLSANHKRRHIAPPPKHGTTVPRRMPPEVFDALRAITGTGPSLAYEDVRANVRARLAPDPSPDPSPIRHRTQLETVWRAAFHDVIRHHAGRDAEQIAIGGNALTHELARIATDEHMRRPSASGKRARRAVSTWLARAHESQQY